MRVLLIDDHPIVRNACHRLLTLKGGMEVAEAATAAEGAHLATDFEPDVIVLDLKLPDGSGLDALTGMVAQAPGAKIIVFSMYDDPAFAARALEAGAHGYMTKNDNPDLLLQAIERVAAGEIFLTASMAEKLTLIADRSGAIADLSSREQQVLHLLRQGKTLGEIADDLNIAYRTAAHAAAQIKAKLRIGSTAALIKWAVEHPDGTAPVRVRAR
jgi:DNA-binding NarL/FixJ family response regulator